MKSKINSGIGTSVIQMIPDKKELENLINQGNMLVDSSGKVLKGIPGSVAAQTHDALSWQLDLEKKIRDVLYGKH